MYAVYNDTLQKELATNYNSKGQLIKRYWFWNGDSNYHNVEIFYYLENGNTNLVLDSFANGDIQRTSFSYNKNKLVSSVTIDNKMDTCNLRYFLGNDTAVHKWYRGKKCYRTDTAIFEKGNVKRRYFGLEYDFSGEASTWNYYFLNQFDVNGNLIVVRSSSRNPFKYYTKYNYDKNNLLMQKQEIVVENGIPKVTYEYIFKYE